MPDTIHYIAFGGGPEHYGLLPDAAIERWRDISKLVTEEWKKATDESRRRATLITDCLDKLAMTLLQAHRLKTAHDNLIATALAQRELARIKLSQTGGAPITMAYRGAEACGDFESLLLQARAALDCLTLLIACELQQDPNHSFRELPNVLKNNVPRGNHLGQTIMSVIALSEAWTQGLLTKVQNDGLRDFVAHRGSLTTRTSNCFGITFIQPDHVLIFDCETKLFPIFRTTTEAVQHVAQLMLNSISAILGMRPLPIDAFNCCWQNRSVVFSDYILAQPDGSPPTQYHLTVITRMNPDGFTTAKKNVNPKLFNLAFDLKTLDTCGCPPPNSC